MTDKVVVSVRDLEHTKLLVLELRAMLGRLEQEHHPESTTLYRLLKRFTEAKLEDDR